MHLTNDFGIPELIVQAILNDPYDRGDSHITTTQLVDAPQIQRLRSLHEDEITEDASERVWALYGQAVHAIIERAALPHMVTEQRMYANIGGTILGGQIDLLLPAEGHIDDWKITSTYRTQNGIPWTWEAQLNVNAYLCEMNDVTINSLGVGVFYRDWHKRQSRRPLAYPRAPVEHFDVQLWDFDFTENVVRTRLEDHLAAVVRPCTDEERWYRGETHALLKEGRKTALRVLESRSEAVAWAKMSGFSDEDGGLADGYSVEHRPGQYVRCESYCPVARWCPQWRATLASAAQAAPLESTLETLP